MTINRYHWSLFVNHIKPITQLFVVVTLPEWASLSFFKFLSTQALAKSWANSCSYVIPVSLNVMMNQLTVFFSSPIGYFNNFQQWLLGGVISNQSLRCLKSPWIAAYYDSVFWWINSLTYLNNWLYLQDHMNNITLDHPLPLSLEFEKAAVISKGRAAHTDTAYIREYRPDPPPFWALCITDCCSHDHTFIHYAFILLF